MREPSLAELKAFDATARAGSMSAAARALGIRQPTVSTHIAELERHFGVELFFRRGQRVELTDLGHALRSLTHRIFQAEADALMLLSSARQQYVGHLALCAVGPYNVTPMLKIYRQRWPSVSVAVSVGDSRQIVERVLDYRGDLGVLVHAVDDERIHCVPFRRQQLIVFAPCGHPLAQREHVVLTDLAEQEFVMREHGSTTRRVFEDRLATAGVTVRSTLQIGSREAVREAVAQGLGLGVVADAAYLADDRLVRLKVADLDAHTHSHVICLKERSAVPLIAGFLSIVDELRARATA